MHRILLFFPTMHKHNCFSTRRSQYIPKDLRFYIADTITTRRESWSEKSLMMLPNCLSAKHSSLGWSRLVDGFFFSELGCCCKVMNMIVVVTINGQVFTTSLRFLIFHNELAENGDGLIFRLHTIYG